MPVTQFSFGGGDDYADNPDVAVLNDGRMVVSWIGYPTSGAEGYVWIRFYDSAGAADGEPILVRHVTGTSSDEFMGAWPTYSDVTVLANGNILVAWSQEDVDTEPSSWVTSNPSVHGQVLSPSGATVGGPFVIQNSGGNDNEPEITALENGGFVAVWYHSTQSGGMVQAQAFNASGEAVGALLSLPRGAYSVAGLADGGFVISTESYAGGMVSLETRTFDSSGVATGPTVTLGSSGSMDVSALAGGGYVAAWTSGGTIRTQTFDSDNVAVSGITTISTVPYAVRLGVAGTDNGGFAVTWVVQTAPDVYSVMAQRFTEAGTASGAPFQLATGVNLPSTPSVAGLPGGGLVVVWEDVNNDSVHGRVAPGVAPLFTPGLDDVNFNALTPDQAAAIDAGSQLYDAGAGDDTVYLPNAGVTQIRPGIAWNDSAPFNGGTGVDTIHGGDRHDEINGGADGDILHGNGGIDQINGGSGVDFIFGGAAEDTLIGSGDGDWIYGGSQADVILGDDLLAVTGGADDNIYGEDGEDTIDGGPGGDTIFGGNDADTIDGGSGEDTINGGEGGDTLRGGADNDYIRSGEIDGDDAGGNFLFGDGGDDVLVALGSDVGAAPDQLTGGSGTDFFLVDTRQGSEDLVMDFQVGETAATFLTGNPKSFVMVAEDSGTTVVVFNDNGTVAARFKFDDKISPAQLEVLIVTNDEGVQFLAVQRQLNPLAEVGAAITEWAPLLEAIAGHIHAALKDKIGDAITEETTPTILEFLKEKFASNPAVLEIVQSVIAKLQAAVPGITDDALDRVAKQITDQIGKFVIDAVLEAFEDGRGPNISTNEVYDFWSLILSPIAVLTPTGQMFVKISDFLNTSILAAMDTYFAIESVNLASSTEVRRGTITVVGPTGTTSHVSTADELTSELGSSGVDTVYSELSVEVLPEPIENYHQLDPSEGNLNSAFGRLAAAGSSTVGGNSLDNHLTGNNGSNQILGRAGNDVLTGSGGNDSLDGGTGEDTAVYGDAVQNYVIYLEGSSVRIIDAAIGTVNDGSDIVTGVEWFWFGDQRLSLAEVQALGVDPPVVRAKMILTESGQDFTVGGNVAIFGTAASGEVVEVIGGDVLLDASFNIGGDTVVLPGNAGSYTAILSGSFVTIAGGGISVAIPIGAIGLAVQFADSTRTLRFDSGTGQVVLGTQQVTSTEAAVAASGPPLTDPAEVGPASLAKLILTEAGQDIDIGGNVAIFGTAEPGEVVTVLDGTVQLDASFNLGGDTVVLPGNAGTYSATLSGSFVTIAGGDISVAIPIGLNGITVDFADGSALLRYDADSGQVMLGDGVVSPAGSVAAEPLLAGKEAPLDGLGDDLGWSGKAIADVVLRSNPLEISDGFSFA